MYLTLLSSVLPVEHLLKTDAINSSWALQDVLVSFLACNAQNARWRLCTAQGAKLGLIILHVLYCVYYHGKKSLTNRTLYEIRIYFLNLVFCSMVTRSGKQIVG